MMKVIQVLWKDKKQTNEEMLKNIIYNLVLVL